MPGIQGGLFCPCGRGERRLRSCRVPWWPLFPAVGGLAHLSYTGDGCDELSLIHLEWSSGTRHWSPTWFQAFVCVLQFHPDFILLTQTPSLWKAAPLLSQHFHIPSGTYGNFWIPVTPTADSKKPAGQTWAHASEPILKPSPQSNFSWRWTVPGACSLPKSVLEGKRFPWYLCTPHTYYFTRWGSGNEKLSALFFLFPWSLRAGRGKHSCMFYFPFLSEWNLIHITCSLFLTPFKTLVSCFSSNGGTGCQERNQSTTRELKWKSISKPFNCYRQKTVGVKLRIFYEFPIGKQPILHGPFCA